MMFVVTQMYGVIKLKALRIVYTGAYLLMAVFVYSGLLGTAHQIAQIHQIFWIPTILYGLVFVIIWLNQGGIYLLGEKKGELDIIKN